MVNYQKRYVHEDVEGDDEAKSSHPAHPPEPTLKSATNVAETVTLEWG